jgi:hypothetical protein
VYVYASSTRYCFNSAEGRKSGGTAVVYEQPLLRQVYSAVFAAGRRGLTCGEVAVMFGITALDARSITRNLIRKKCVAGVFHDEGKKCLQRLASQVNLFSDELCSYFLCILLCLPSAV